MLLVACQLAVMLLAVKTVRRASITFRWIIAKIAFPSFSTYTLEWSVLRGHDETLGFDS